MVEDEFFPPGSRELRLLIGRLRNRLGPIAEIDFLRSFEDIQSLNDGLVTTRYSIEPQFTVARQKDQIIRFPRMLPRICIDHISFGYTEWLRRKYTLPGFVEVAEGDTVVDCGAFVGGFTLAVAPVAGKIYAFEPSADNFACVRRNTNGLGNVVACRAALSNRVGVSKLNISSSNVEHSLLSIDGGELLGGESVDTYRLDEFLTEQGEPSFDFLKLEAEGFEFEIFEGAERRLPTKLAIDVSPERGGKSPMALFDEILGDMKYDTRLRGNVLFARKRPIEQ